MPGVQQPNVFFNLKKLYFIKVIKSHQKTTGRPFLAHLIGVKWYNSILYEDELNQCSREQ